MNNFQVRFWFHLTQSTFLLQIIWLSLAMAPQVKGQTYVYDAFIKNHKVGQMTVVREVNDESEKISVKTHIEAHMLVKIRVDFESHSTYMNGALVNAEAISKTNGHVHSKAITTRKNGRYFAERNDLKPVGLDMEDYYGGDLFYFEEPKNISQVYALATGELLAVTKEGEDIYYFEHDGKKELHRYEEGKLAELRIEHRLYTVVFKLVD